MRRLVCAFVVPKSPKTGFLAARPILVWYYQTHQHGIAWGQIWYAWSICRVKWLLPSFKFLIIATNQLVVAAKRQLWGLVAITIRGFVLYYSSAVRRPDFHSEADLTKNLILPLENVLWSFLTIKNTTRACSRWGAIANPHAKVFDPPAPHSPTLGHDLGNRMKILFNMFSFFYLWEHTQSLV